MIKDLVILLLMGAWFSETSAFGIQNVSFLTLRQSRRISLFAHDEKHAPKTRLFPTVSSDIDQSTVMKAKIRALAAMLAAKLNSTATVAKQMEHHEQVQQEKQTPSVEETRDSTTDSAPISKEPSPLQAKTVEKGEAILPTEPLSAKTEPAPKSAAEQPKPAMTVPESAAEAKPAMTAAEYAKFNELISDATGSFDQPPVQQPEAVVSVEKEEPETVPADETSSQTETIPSEQPSVPTKAQRRLEEEKNAVERIKGAMIQTDFASYFDDLASGAWQPSLTEESESADESTTEEQAAVLEDSSSPSAVEEQVVEEKLIESASKETVTDFESPEEPAPFPKPPPGPYLDNLASNIRETVGQSKTGPSASYLDQLPSDKNILSGDGSSVASSSYLGALNSGNIQPYSFEELLVVEKSVAIEEPPPLKEPAIVAEYEPIVEEPEVVAAPKVAVEPRAVAPAPESATPAVLLREPEPDTDFESPEEPAPFPKPPPGPYLDKLESNTRETVGQSKTGPSASYLDQLPSDKNSLGGDGSSVASSSYLGALSSGNVQPYSFEYLVVEKPAAVEEPPPSLEEPAIVAEPEPIVEESIVVATSEVAVESRTVEPAPESAAPAVLLREPGPVSTEELNVEELESETVTAPIAEAPVPVAAKDTAPTGKAVLHRDGEPALETDEAIVEESDQSRDSSSAYLDRLSTDTGVQIEDRTKVTSYLDQLLSDTSVQRRDGAKDIQGSYLDALNSGSVKPFSFDDVAAVQEPEPVVTSESEAQRPAASSARTDPIPETTIPHQAEQESLSKQVAVSKPDTSNLVDNQFFDEPGEVVARYVGIALVALSALVAVIMGQGPHY